MAKEREFPITIKAGGAAIKIYQSPLHVPAVDAGSAEKRIYDSFLVAYLIFSHTISPGWFGIPKECCKTP